MTRRVARLRARGFRNLGSLETEIGASLTVIHGPNAAGKTNLLEAVYAGLVGRSFRTNRDRELVAFGEKLARVELELSGAEGADASCLTSIATDGERRHRVEGGAERPPVCVFHPDRLALVKGPPATRRGHLDGLGAALWPARASLRRDYGRALGQRNALLGRVRAGQAAEADLDPWDRELAARGTELRTARRATAEALAPPLAELALKLGLEGAAEIRYARRAEDGEDGLVAALRERRESDLRRGFTGRGPHRDELELRLEGRALRTYGSQGQQRLILLALLLAERELLAAERREPPLMLLDDVMSELDPKRRELLVERLAAGGQALITATEADQVPPIGPRTAEIALAGPRRLEAVA